MSSFASPSGAGGGGGGGQPGGACTALMPEPSPKERFSSEESSGGISSLLNLGGSGTGLKEKQKVQSLSRLFKKAHEALYMYIFLKVNYKHIKSYKCSFILPTRSIKEKVKYNVVVFSATLFFNTTLCFILPEDSAPNQCTLPLRLLGPEIGVGGPLPEVHGLDEMGEICGEGRGEANHVEAGTARTSKQMEGKIEKRKKTFREPPWP